MNKSTDILIYRTGKHPQLSIPRTYRIEIAKNILEQYKDKTIKIFGKRWGELAPDGEYSGKQFIEEINKSKICVDILTPKKDSLKHRVFECGACGVPVITRNIPEIRQLFKINKEILVYNTKEELYEKINILLKDENYRRYLSENIYIYKACISRHNISNRVNSLIGAIRRNRHFN